MHLLTFLGSAPSLFVLVAACFFRTMVVPDPEITIMAEDVPTRKLETCEAQQRAISFLGCRVQATRWVSGMGGLMHFGWLHDADEIRSSLSSV